MRENPTESTGRRGRRTARAFTLVELLVAISLMLILTGVIVFVFAKTRDVSLDAEANAVVYYNARQAMDQIGRDITRAIKTVDLEPFEDKEDSATRMKNAHYDPSLNERVWPSARVPAMDISTMDYIYSMMLFQGSYDEKVGADAIEHASDMVFLKTIASDYGKPREAFISYFLVDTDQKRPILKRRFQWFDREKQEFNPDPPREDDVCFFVTDFKIEFYYVDNRDYTGRPRKPGIWLTPEAADKLGIKDPHPDPSVYTFNYHYDERAKIDRLASGQGQLIVRPQEGFEVTFKTKSDFLFPALSPGDRIYIYQARPNKPPGQIPWVIDQDLTIAYIDVTTKRIFFEGRPTLEPTQQANPPSILDCNYRAPYLPPAIRITLRVRDHRADAIRTVQRVFRILGG